jgi:hypothetical protein
MMRSRASYGHPAAHCRDVSSGGFAGHSSGRRADLHGFRRSFPDRWSAFLRAHWRSHLEVALFFDCDERTARNWWAGTSGPRAYHLAIAIRAVPCASAALLPEAA